MSVELDFPQIDAFSWIVKFNALTTPMRLRRDSESRARVPSPRRLGAELASYCSLLVGEVEVMSSTFARRPVMGGCLLVVSALLALEGCTPTKAPPTSVETDTTIDPAMPADETLCQSAFGDACGAACANDDECGDGMYCAGDGCGAECVVPSDCRAGTCSERGRCIEDDDITLDPVLTDPVDHSDAPKCIEGQVEFKAVVPQVWLLLDRSGSMESLLDTNSRWKALGSVLLGDPTTPTDRGVVGDFEDRVAFGAVFYTSGAATTGCVLDLESVALAANNYRDIRQRYNKLGPSGGTPTADSVAATVAVAATSDLTGGPKLLVLATDGEPGGCSPRTGDPALEVENEVAKAFSKSIQTFAISVGTETNLSHMQRVANIGVGLPAGETAMKAKLYTAESQDALKLAFSTILSEVPRSCVFSLNGRVKQADAAEGVVVLNGQTLTYGDANGWTLKEADQVELLGDACAQVQAGEDTLDIDFPCSVFVPVK
jgi:hypothetical protein